MMKKKVKKIPKYSGGIAAAGQKPNLTITKNPAGDAYKMQQMKNFSNNASSTPASMGNIASLSNDMLMNTFGIEDNSTAGVMLNSTAQGADIGGAIMPGWGHLIGGAAGAIMGSLKSGSVDENTGDITYGGIFGHSKGYLMRKSNRIKNSIQSRTQTQNLQALYAMNSNVVLNPNVLAAEGGIIPTTTWAEDDGEYGRTPYGLIYKEPEEGKPTDSNIVHGPVGTQILSDKLKYPGTKDTIAGHYEKSIAKVKNYGNDKYAKNSQLLNDRYALKLFDEHLEVLENMKKKDIKKIKNGIPAYEGGFNGRTGYTGISHYKKERKLEPLQAVEWNGNTGYFDVEGGFHTLPPNPALWPDSVYSGNYKDVPVTYTVGGDKISKSADVTYPTGAKYPIDPVNIEPYEWKTTPTFVPNPNAPAMPQYGASSTNTTSREVNPINFFTPNIAGSGIWGDPNLKQVNVEEAIDSATQADPISTKKSTSTKVIPVENSTKNTTKKSGKKQEIVTPEVSDKKTRTALLPNLYDFGERHWLRGKLDEPKQSFASLAKTTPEKIKAKGVSSVVPTSTPRSTTKGDGSNTGSDWRDNLYRMAVLTQPLWDKAEAESVNYESPVYKYMPTAVDVSSQLRDVDQSYALARYNFANLYPNTGAGMAAGLQAASNRAKQLADIRQYQTNALNELIGKNVGIYNNWANEHARIMNSVYDKTAANRAAARNINRQNRAAALTNYGAMLSDDKKMAMEKLKFAALKPAIQSTYEDASMNEIMNMYNSLFG